MLMIPGVTDAEVTILSIWRSEGMKPKSSISPCNRKKCPYYGTICSKCNSCDYNKNATWKEKKYTAKGERSDFMGRNNPSWCCDKIEELIEDYKISAMETENEEVKRQLQITIEDLENILYG